MTRRADGSPSVAVLDLGCANVHSVITALQRAGARAFAVQGADELQGAAAVVVPGVAHFDRLCRQIDSRGLRAPLLALIDAGTPYLGICAGFQLLFEGSEEAPGRRGLGVFGGSVRRLQSPKMPHVGWTRCDVAGGAAIVESGWAYFAHSFAPVAETEGCIATATSGTTFAAACSVNRLTGVQFHPEKSAAYGARFLRRWLEASDAC